MDIDNPLRFLWSGSWILAWSPAVLGSYWGQENWEKEEVERCLSYSAKSNSKARWNTVHCFLIPQIDNDNKSLFVGGHYKSCLSGWWVKRHEITWQRSNIIQMQGWINGYPPWIIMVIAGLASVRKTLTQPNQAGRGKKTVCWGNQKVFASW